MRKCYFVLIALCILMTSGCDADLNVTRKISVFIPEHPWEKFAPVRLWYNLVWNGVDGKKELYVDNNTRDVTIEIPAGRTVFICAYPLGEMRAFGCGVTPYDDCNEFTLSQNDGYLADLLLNSDQDAVSGLNWLKLKERAISQTEDFRTINDTLLIKNVLNGTMKASAVVAQEKIEIPPFAAPGGTWISESVNDARMIFAGNESLQMFLPYGVNRFLNHEKNLELRITVDGNGNIFTYQRQALVSSLNSHTVL